MINERGGYVTDCGWSTIVMRMCVGATQTLWLHEYELSRCVCVGRPTGLPALA